MASKVIGSGFVRTGTNSLKLAIEELGFSPCHHMYEVKDNPCLLPRWQRAAAGDLPKWDDLFDGYPSNGRLACSVLFARTGGHYPAARVIHSVRLAEAWFDSVHKTIYPRMRDWRQMEPHDARPPGDGRVADHRSGLRRPL